MGRIDIERALAEHGVKPTGNRLMVARVLSEAVRPLCLGDIEGVLETVDKSNIFRALTLFRERRLVHVIEDETGVLHYEMCTHRGEGDDDDLHAHFYCRRCHRMECLPGVMIPAIGLPEGYATESITYIVKGICPRCAAKGD